MAGWQHCGEGFSGVEKFKQAISNISECSKQSEEDVECRIVSDKTPEGKRKARNRTRKQRDGPILDRSFTHHGKHMIVSQTMTWKQDEFLAGFSISQRTASASEDIDSASSSSDESAPDRPKLPENVSKKRKKLHSSEQGASCIQKHTDSRQKRLKILNVALEEDEVLISQPSSGDALEEEESSGRHQDISAFQRDVASCGDISDGIASQTNASCKETRLSSEAIKSSSSSVMDSTQIQKQFCQNANQVKSKRSGCFIRRVNRHLNIIGSQDSSGQISDIDSDIEPAASDMGESGTSDEDITVSDPEDSDDEVPRQNSDQAGTMSDEHLLSDSQCLSIRDDTSPSACSSADGHKIKASDWIMAVQKQKTPLKNDQPMAPPGADSAKKKRKFARGSLAEQLARLLNREKSSVRFWYHSVKEGTSENKNNRSMTVQLLFLKKHFSCYISKCRILEQPSRFDPCKAIFIRETVEKLSLKSGMTVQIFPPWQQLDESDGGCTLLCTQFVQVLPTTDQEDTGIADSSRDSHKIRVSATWKCPCSRDPYLPTSACPAALSPVIFHPPRQDLTSSSSTHTFCSAMLHSVCLTPNPSTVAPASARSLLESMEMVRSDTACLPPFSATILRIFWHRVKETFKIRYQLLLEDSAGTMAVVKLPDDYTDTHTSVLKLEGKSCVCSGLCVLSRTNRDREPVLFTVIDKTWMQHFPSVQSQEGGSDASQLLQAHPKAPNFAYMLQFAPSVNGTFSEEGDTTSEETNLLNLMTLQEAVQSDPGSRVTFVAKALLLPRFEQARGSRTVFVYDSSCTSETGTVVQRFEIGSECVIKESASSIYLFRDIVLEKGHLQCDNYTLVLDKPSWDVWSFPARIDPSVIDDVTACELKLPSLCHTSAPGSIVSVDGTISNVDESSAYSWQECSLCGSEQLTSSEEFGEIYCTKCNKRVVSPVMKMKMEAYVKCRHHTADFVVKLNLTQKTIESLLPSEVDDEGYDIEQVINKPVKCLVCLVQGRINKSSTCSKDDHSNNIDGSNDACLHLTELICPERL